MSCFKILLGLGALAAALPARDTSLFQRQERENCEGLTSCEITQDFWIAFGLGSYMATEIADMGLNVLPPALYAAIHAPSDAGAADLSGCGSLDGSSENCRNSQSISDTARANCPSINEGPEDRCLRYTDPRAGLVIENWIQLSEGVRAQAAALLTARDNLVNTNFVSELIDGMAEESGSFVDEIVDFALALPFAILFAPKTAFDLALTALSTLDSLTVDVGLVPPRVGATPFIQQIIANEQIEDEKERVKDQMSRQIDAIVDGERQRHAAILHAVFNTSLPAFLDGDANAARNTPAFRFLENGAFLQPRPSQDEMVASAETSLKNSIVSAVMNGMGWQVIRHFGLQLEVAGQPGSAGQTCRDGQKGIPDTLGAPCVLFRRGSNFDDPRMADPAVIEKFVDWQAMANNADQCAGNQEAPADGESPLPPCFYSFPVTTI